ncbi:hypothetical protein H8356DRAFT_1759529 [Neocallimastix lanati (nom. inval.)]|nr:hypothetical protein H8356DRAFT_1759529 [Neocallimastix sp. JGI-2020a]
MNVNNALYSAEQVIDRSIIRSGEGHGGEEKQERFRKTAMAMQEIISKKLYKAKHSTMEQYFKEVFKLSRASVYRFVDASRVLNQLEGFHILPFGERQCRTLRRCTKDLQTIRLLWSTVLNKYGEDPSLITSTIIQNIWDEMLEKKLVDPSKISTIKSNNSSGDKNNKNKKDIKTTQKSTINNNMSSTRSSQNSTNNTSKLMIPSSGSSSNISDISCMNQKFIPSYSSTATLFTIDDPAASIYTITNCNNQSYSVTSQTQSPLNKNNNSSYTNFTSSLQSNSTLVATPTSTAVSISHVTNNGSSSNMNISSSSMTNINNVNNNSQVLNENYISSNVINSNPTINALGYSLTNQNYMASSNSYSNSSYSASRLTPNFQRRIPNNSTSSITTSTPSSTNLYYQNFQYSNTNDISGTNSENYITNDRFGNVNVNYSAQFNDFINFNNYPSYNQNTYYTQNQTQNSQCENHYSNYTTTSGSTSLFSSSEVPYQWYGNEKANQDINPSTQKYFTSASYYSQLRMLNGNSENIASYQNQRVIPNNYQIPYSVDSLNNVDNQNNSNRNMNIRNINISTDNNRLNNNNSYINNYPCTVFGIVNSQNNIIQ